jgi:hypothetical protein
MDAVSATRLPHAARGDSAGVPARSWPGVLGAVTVLLALPLAVLSEVLLGPAASGTVVHLALGLGVALVAVSTSQLGLPRWLARVGGTTATALSAVFLLQGLTDLTQSGSLSGLAYGILGQWPEKALGDLLLAWFIAVNALVGRGKTRLLGWLVLSVVSTYELARSLPGVTVDADMPGLRALLLLPFVWFISEAAKRRRGRVAAADRA